MKPIGCTLLVAAFVAAAAAEDSLYYCLPKSPNIVYSPWTVHRYLRRAAQLTNDAARAQIDQRLEKANAPSAQQMQQIAQQLHDCADIRFSAANALYAAQDAQMNSQYPQQFQQKLQRLDFANNARRANDAIKEYVAQNTDNKINQFNFDAADANTRYADIDTLAFNADFASQFDRQNTKKDTFFNADGSSTRNVNMMEQQVSEIRCGKLPLLHAEAVVIPYKGNAVDLYVIVPELQTTIWQLERSLKGIGVHSLYDQLHQPQQQIKLQLPRFTVRSDLFMQPAYKRCGLRDLCQHAAWTKVTQQPLSTERDMLSAYVEVREQGTSAAAAHAASLQADGPCMHEPEGEHDHEHDQAHRAQAQQQAQAQQLEFVANRPFLFYVIARESGVILYQGRVTKMSPDY